MRFVGFWPDGPQPARQKNSIAARARVILSPAWWKRQTRAPIRSAPGSVGGRSKVVRNDVAAVRGDQRPHHGHGDRLADELDVPVAEDRQGPARVVAEGLVV